MSEGNDRDRRGLRLVRGGRLRVGGVVIRLAPSEHPPSEVDALVVEDDTYSVLSADPGFTEPTEHPIRVWTELHEAQPASPGAVIVKPGRPLRLLAVVHDLAQDPTCREEWVALALNGCLHEAEARQLRRMAMPILGGVHGRVTASRFAELLRVALERERPGVLQEIWLITDARGDQELESLLASP